jgi:chromosome segregation ATPase
MMFKKLGILAAIFAAGVGVFGWACGSYTSCAWNKVQTAVKRQVPLEFEIERIRHQVAQLVPDMKRNLSVIAEEMVAVDALKSEIAVTRENLENRKAEILTMSEALESSERTISFDGRERSAARIREKLERDFASYKRAEAELKAKEQLLDARERALEVAREQLANLKTQKQELEVAIAELETELKTLRLAQARNKIHFDDSALAKAKASLAELRTRINVEKKTNELAGEFANDFIPEVEKKTRPTGDLQQEIKAYFGKPTQEKLVQD